ncbi:hypothetical protein GCM10025868_24830 [Angustibacter aerolatus]|uniref:NmrA-like domain-containing protein n=1 Tax=Angustibacter aerolatus TaxID=1162965 RepID=A0ABQ6JGC0_9ACTN|nr:hypothetical protein GCM10025868_24830 [Angustibacter aerolatus]
MRVAAADYADPASLDAAFAGAEQVLIVSVVEGDRVALHRNAIEAAERAGVRHVVYTSAPYADTTSMLLAADHRGTEEVLAASGLTVTVLRNAWYVENYTGRVDTLREHGLVGAAGEGRVSIALRREYAEAAAAVLLDPAERGRVHELGGEPVTLEQVAAAISAATGETITYTDLPVEGFRDVLAGSGMPDPLPTIFADVDRAIRDGEPGRRPRRAHRIGRPPPDAARRRGARGAAGLTPVGGGP